MAIINMAMEGPTDIKTKQGLIGFDSEMKWFVSMQCVVGWHYNLRRQNFNWQ